MYALLECCRGKVAIHIIATYISLYDYVYRKYPSFCNIAVCSDILHFKVIATFWLHRGEWAHTYVCNEKIISWQCSSATVRLLAHKTLH